MNRNLSYFLSGSLVLVFLLFGLHYMLKYELIQEDEKTVFQHLSRYLKLEKTIVRFFLKTADVEGLRKELKKLGKETKIRFTVIAPDGTVIADSHFNPAEMENHANRPEVREALAGRQGRIVRYSTTASWRVLKIAEPLYLNGKLKAVVRCEMKPRQMLKLQKRLEKTLFAIAIAIFLAFSAVFLLNLRREKIVLEKIKLFIRNVLKGNFSSRIFLNYDSSTRQLSNELNYLVEFIEAELKKRTEEEELLEKVFKAMKEAVLIVKEDGRILRANPSARELLPFREQLVGKHLWECIPSPELIEKFPGLKNNLSLEVETQSKYLLVNISPIAGTRGFVVVISDITESKKLTEMKARFVAHASHELRTPLTAIKGYLEILEKELQGEMKSFAEKARKRVDKLIELVNDLLLLSALEKGKHIVKERVDMKKIVESVVSHYEGRIAEKGLVLEKEFPPNPVIVEGNPNLLEHLVLNLVDNAYKYTDTGKIKVGLQEEEDKVIFFVEDTGKGIPQQLLGRIFERFYVIEGDRERTRKGTGLGLAIVKHIAKRHNANIEVSSELGKGTLFRVIFPKS